jgi:hypothetical protein
MVSYSHNTGGYNDKDWLHDIILGSIYVECFPDRTNYSLSLASIDYGTFNRLTFHASDIVLVARAIVMLGQLLTQGTPGGDYNLLNQKKITYGHLLQFIAKHSPTESKWGVEASQWAEKMRGLFDNIVDIDTWSSVVHDCSLQVSDPFLRKVLQHLQMFTSGIPDGMTHLFCATV